MTTPILKASRYTGSLGKTLVLVLGSMPVIAGCGLDEVLYPDREPQCKVGCQPEPDGDDVVQAPGAKRSGQELNFDAQFWLDATPFSRLGDADLGELLLSNPILLSEGRGGRPPLGASMQSGLAKLQSLIEGAAKNGPESRQSEPLLDCYAKELEELPAQSAGRLDYAFNPALCFPLENVTQYLLKNTGAEPGELEALAYEDAYRLIVPLDQDSFSLTDAAEPYAVIHFGRSPAAPYLPLLRPGPQNLRRLGFHHVQLQAFKVQGPSGLAYELIWDYFGLMGANASEPFSLTSSVNEESETVTWAFRGNMVQVNGWSSDPRAPTLGQPETVEAYGRIVQFDNLSITVPQDQTSQATPLAALERPSSVEVRGQYLIRIPQPGGMLDFLVRGLESTCEIEIFAGTQPDSSQSLGVTSLCPES